MYSSWILAKEFDRNRNKGSQFLFLVGLPREVINLRDDLNSCALIEYKWLGLNLKTCLLEVEYSDLG